MPTNLPNRASLNYTYGENTGSVKSNTTNTVLLDEYTISIVKTPIVTPIEAGDDVYYILSLENTGAGALYNPKVTDDLGTGTSETAPLGYVDGSAKFYYNGDTVSGTATLTDSKLTLSSTVILQPGEKLNIVYAASTQLNQAEDIVNTAVATANSGTATGAEVTAEASATISFTASANIVILKSANSESVVSGDTLTYTFTLINTGNSAADSVTLTDELPPEFTVNSVSYTTDGVRTEVPGSEYSITAPNTLVLPAEGSTVVIGVPAAGETGAGITIVEVTGTVA